ncbi:MAG: potassium channel family protein [Actinomycetia bacterium]|nr:potassium channel family protein [Actinomycetes bacterium]MCP5033147.1 potassium channel family protein [Actinomycetes bacterium]
MPSPTPLTDRIRLPGGHDEPLVAVLRRVGLAFGLVIFVALVVRISGDGYVDVTGDEISFLDAIYYASVTVTTTGYGDITAISNGSRLAAVLLITPARILFLILVVGTTVEVLTDQSRRLISARRWRRFVDNHILICGFGATGQSAADELVSRGAERTSIVVVDITAGAVERASQLGFAAIQGDATQNAVLEQAAVDRARAIVVTPNRDDTAVLIILTAREMNPQAHIVAGGRERENLHLLRQGGADQVIDSTAAVGRMLGLATDAPGAVSVLDDLIDSGSGLELVEVAPHLSGGSASVPMGATLVAVIRAGERIPQADLDPAGLQPDDRLIVLRDSSVR